MMAQSTGTAFHEVATDGHRYVLDDHDHDAEWHRLEHLEAMSDTDTVSRLRRTGVAEGWRCLEVGAGRG